VLVDEVFAVGEEDNSESEGSYVDVLISPEITPTVPSPFHPTNNNHLPYENAETLANTATSSLACESFPTNQGTVSTVATPTKIKQLASFYESKTAQAHSHVMPKSHSLDFKAPTYKRMSFEPIRNSRTSFQPHSFETSK